MSSQEQDASPITVAVRNVGGISSTEVEFSPGVTILAGRNATNRTSFLRALMASMGSDDVSLKGDAEEGSVEIDLDSGTYHRTITRRGGTTVFDGEPYLDDCEVADLFAFLLESNAARRAVERDDDLYDVIMRPVDTAEIDDQIDALEAEREDIEAELEELGSVKEELPGLEERRTELEAKLEEERAALDEKQAALDDLDDDGEQPSDLKARFEELRETRQELERTQEQIDDEQRIIEALEDDRAEIEERLKGLASVDPGEVDDLDDRISRRRAEVQSIESTLGELQSVIQFNQSLVDGERPAVLNSLEPSAADDGEPAVTDQLLDDDAQLMCWTCGTEVSASEIETTVDRLREIHVEQIERRNQLKESISELEAERKHIEQTREERRDLRRRLEEIEPELEERRDQLDQLTETAEELEASVESLEGEVDEIEREGSDDQLELRRTINEIQLEVERLETRRQEVIEEIDAIEARLERREPLQEELEAIEDEIADLRTRIEQLEADAVDQFNDRMQDIIEVLGFDNIERVWLERVESEVQDGRRTVRKDTFKLHVVRTSESGSVYEDTVDHLSESEREVVGLVFALSGYLVHDVYERVPFMILDSLEAIDATRIAGLIDYLKQFVPNLVVALLPEDASAVDESYERVTDI